MGTENEWRIISFVVEITWACGGVDAIYTYPTKNRDILPVTNTRMSMNLCLMENLKPL